MEKSWSCLGREHTASFHNLKRTCAEAERTPKENLIQKKKKEILELKKNYFWKHQDISSSVIKTRVVAGEDQRPIVANKTEIPQTENKDLWNLCQYANHSELEVLKKQKEKKEQMEEK